MNKNDLTHEKMKGCPFAAAFMGQNKPKNSNSQQPAYVIPKLSGRNALNSINSSKAPGDEPSYYE